MELEAFLKNVPQTRSKFKELCLKKEAILFGNFILKSGLKSNTFFNSGLLTDSESFDVLTDLLVAKLIEIDVDFNGLMGCPYKSIPIVSVMCVKYYKLTGRKINFGYFRKEEKTHGEGKLFVGSPEMYDENAKVIVVDDVLSTGSSAQQTLSVLETTKVKVVGVLYLLNREMNYGAFKSKLRESNIDLFEVIRLDEIVDISNVHVQE